MNNSSWVLAIEEDKLIEDSMHVAFPKGISIILIKKEGKIYAVSNKCAHMACPLSGGTLVDHTLTCPCHDWKYDIRTGEFLHAKEIKIPIYQWKLDKGKIFVKIEG